MFSGTSSASRITTLVSEETFRPRWRGIEGDPTGFSTYWWEASGVLPTESDQSLKELMTFDVVCAREAAARES